MAQRKRAGPITQRSVDRNHPLLHTNFDHMIFTILGLDFWVHCDMLQTEVSHGSGERRPVSIAGKGQLIDVDH